MEQQTIIIGGSAVVGPGLAFKPALLAFRQIAEQVAELQSLILQHGSPVYPGVPTLDFGKLSFSLLE